ISSNPPRDSLQRLVGEKGGGRLRGVLEHVLPKEKVEATPLYLLLDDISGASLIGGWAWLRWMTDWMRPGQGGGAAPSTAQAAAGDEQARGALAAAAASSDAPGPQPRNMENICTGFQTGSSALNQDGTSSPQQCATKVGPLPHPDD